MTVKELKEFLQYCDEDASILVTGGEKEHLVQEIDVDYLVSKKVLRIDISWQLVNLKNSLKIFQMILKFKLLEEMIKFQHFCIWDGWHVLMK